MPMLCPRGKGFSAPACVSIWVVKVKSATHRIVYPVDCGSHEVQGRLAANDHVQRWGKRHHLVHGVRGRRGQRGQLVGKPVAPSSSYGKKKLRGVVGARQSQQAGESLLGC